VSHRQTCNLRFAVQSALLVTSPMTAAYGVLPPWRLLTFSIFDDFIVLGMGIQTKVLNPEKEEGLAVYTR
jgi:hypothetical protein